MRYTRIAILILSFFSVLSSGFAADQLDQLYAQRLASLKSPVELTYNDAVRKHIDQFLAEPERTAEVLGRCQVHFQIIERMLREKQLPVELKYLIVATSGANNVLVPNTGATGYWRMMYNVARTYGLKINSFVDERKDLGKSTEAAASYLNDLNNIYNNWHLSMAAYANTPAILNKAIRQSGYKMNFWEIYPMLPAESRELVPQFIAAAYIFNFFREHNILPIKAQLLTSFDTVVVNKWLSFQQITSTLDIETEELRELNPIFKKDIIPQGTPPYLVKLPRGKAKFWAKLKDSVYIYVPKPTDMSPVTIQKDVPPTPPPVTPPATEGENAENKEASPKEVEKEEKKSTGFNKKRLHYVVRSGDVLGNVADWYDVTPAQIKSWNKMRSNKLRAGQKLIIWEPTDKFAYYNKINGMSKAKKNALRKKD